MRDSTADSGTNADPGSYGDFASFRNAKGAKTGAILESPAEDQLDLLSVVWSELNADVRETILMLALGALSHECE